MILIALITKVLVRSSNWKIKNKKDNKELRTKKMLFINLNYTKNKSFMNNYGKNNDDIKEKMGNKKYKIKKKLKIDN